jgi:hypothetical protein
VRILFKGLWVCMWGRYAQVLERVLSNGHEADTV